MASPLSHASGLTGSRLDSACVLTTSPVIKGTTATSISGNSAAMARTFWVLAERKMPPC